MASRSLRKMYWKVCREFLKGLQMKLLIISFGSGFAKRLGCDKRLYSRLESRDKIFMKMVPGTANNLVLVKTSEKDQKSRVFHQNLFMGKVATLKGHRHPYQYGEIRYVTIVSKAYKIPTNLPPRNFTCRYQKWPYLKEATFSKA